MFKNTVTVFNYHANTKSWYTTVFKGADLIESRSANATQQGQTNADAVDLLINVRRDQMADTIIYKPKRIIDAQGNVIVSAEDSFIMYSSADIYSEKRYLRPKEYAAIDSPESYFTFAPETDFFIAGNYYSETPILDDDFDEGFYSAMNAEHDGVYLISSAAFYSLIPHFEIGGR